MNQIYRLVWSQISQAWVAVAENARGRGKSISARTLVAAAAALAGGSLLAASAYAANANDATVVGGSGTVTQNGVTTTINQGSQRLAIDWTGLSTAVNENLVFVQPNAQAIALNRITGSSPSTLLGSLTANGQVYILNPNGVLFAAGAQVNVGGLVASTLTMDKDAFISGGSTFVKAANSTGSIDASYSLGSVNGATSAGGLTGANSGTLGSTSYASGRVNNVAAGVTGSAAYLHGSYAGYGTWKESVPGSVSGLWIAYDAGGAPKWVMFEGSTRPFLYSEYSTTVRNLHQLQLMALNLSSNYTLAVDLDATATNGANSSNMWSTSGFVPLGGQIHSLTVNAYLGTFDGGNHVIKLFSPVPARLIRAGNPITEVT